MTKVTPVYRDTLTQGSRWYGYPGIIPGWPELLQCTWILWQRVAAWGYGYPGIIPGWPKLLWCTGILWHRVPVWGYGYPGIIPGWPKLLQCRDTLTEGSCLGVWFSRDHPRMAKVTLLEHIIWNYSENYLSFMRYTEMFLTILHFLCKVDIHLTENVLNVRLDRKNYWKSVDRLEADSLKCGIGRKTTELIGSIFYGKIFHWYSEHFQCGAVL